MAYHLEVLTPSAPTAFDNSMLSTFQRCPRKAFYQYWLNRAFDAKNFPIQFGNAYHKFREVLEKGYIEAVRQGGSDLSTVKDDLFDIAWHAALQVEGGFEDPPGEHNKAYLHTTRLLESCEESFERWLDEKASGRYEILYPEQPFELELPNGEYYTGKVDQILLWNDDVWIRDFKTTSRMGRTYADNFEPNNQFTGYIWAAEKLSNRRVRGVIVEVVYNTKTKGPEFHQFLSTRTPEQVEEWVEETCYEIDEARRYDADKMFPKRTTACSDYGGCNFRDACKKSHWHVRERWLKAKTLESHWDPLNPEDEEGTVD